MNFVHVTFVLKKSDERWFGTLKKRMKGFLRTDSLPALKGEGSSSLTPRRGWFGLPITYSHCQFQFSPQAGSSTRYPYRRVVRGYCSKG